MIDFTILAKNVISLESTITTLLNACIIDNPKLLEIKSLLEVDYRFPQIFEQKISQYKKYKSIIELLWSFALLKSNQTRDSQRLIKNALSGSGESSLATSIMNEILALTYIQEKNFRLALDYLRESIRVDNTNISAYLRLIVCLKLVDEIDEAVRIGKQLEESQKSLDLSFIMMSLSIDRKDINRAMHYGDLLFEYLSIPMVLNKNYTFAVPPTEVLQEIGSVYLRGKRIPQAATVFEFVLQLEPSNVHIRQQLIEIYLDKLGHYEKALELCHEQLNYASGINQETLMAAARCCIKLKQWHYALKYLEKLPVTGYTAFILAVIYYVLGNPRADEYLNYALQQGFISEPPTITPDTAE